MKKLLFMVFAAAMVASAQGNAAKGKDLYNAYTCYGCHGYNGETGRAFVGNWSANLATEENFIRFLRGRANVAPVQPSTSMQKRSANGLVWEQTTSTRSRASC